MKNLFLILVFILALSSCRHEAFKNSKYIIYNIETDRDGTYYRIQDLEIKDDRYEIRDSLNKFQLGDTIEFTISKPK